MGDPKRGIRGPERKGSRPAKPRGRRSGRCAEMATRTGSSALATGAVFVAFSPREATLPSINRTLCDF